MAKLVTIGGYYRPKDNDVTKAPYIKFDRDVSFKKGDVVRLETAKFQKASLEAAVANGKLSEENAEKALERIEKIPEFVIAQVKRFED